MFGLPRLKLFPSNVIENYTYRFFRILAQHFFGCKSMHSKFVAKFCICAFKLGKKGRGKPATKQRQNSTEDKVVFVFPAWMQPSR